VVEPWLQSKKVIAPRKLNEPALKNVLPNPGIA
jgi:hypothetical protein